jgi:phage tail sheath protein FI
MPVSPTYPGIYVQEIPSGVHPITGVATSNTAFVDFFPRGPAGAVKITSWADFERRFGGLDTRSEASYAIQQYYLNGGSVAFIVRALASNAKVASITLRASQYGYGYGYGYKTGYGGSGNVLIQASSAGDWGNRLQVATDYNVKGGAPDLFNIAIREITTVANRTQVIRSETFRNLSLDKTNARYAPQVIAQASELITLDDLMVGGVPDATGNDVINSPQDSDFVTLSGGFDGGSPGNGMSANELVGDPTPHTGIYALDGIAPEIFNILCIPATALLDDGGRATVFPACEEYCHEKRAMYIIDLPGSFDDDASYDAQLTAIDKWTGTTLDGLRSPNGENAAVYFPRLNIPDALAENRPRTVGSSGTLAGVWARTDANRGVWKAPAGIEAGLAGASLFVNLTDLDNGGLNPRGVNVLRSFPVFGPICWGGRTLMGADLESSEWKYIPVRRTALFIEETLYENLKWVVFEPNDEPLWSQIRLNVGAFMHGLFRRGAFQGKTPTEAYFVKCDKDTTPQADIDNGIVNIVVGFAPLKPAEFVIIQIQQIAGQIQT